MAVESHKRSFFKRSERSIVGFYNYCDIFIRPRVLAYIHGLNLRSRQKNTRNIKKNDIILFSTLRNEAFRIPYFLDYYRKIGVNHFIFVDNGSTDNFMKVVSGQSDVSVWHTKASYKASNFGMHWLNGLLHKYGKGHWCVTVDPDEILVFPKCEARTLVELTDWLDSQHRRSMFCLLLDMYGSGSVSSTQYASGEDPLSVAPYFDGKGYVQNFGTARRDVYVQGGARRRVFFRDRPTKAPAINKTPLVKWSSNYSYLSSMHTLSHMALNHPHGLGGLSVTGCLLHFKFLSSLVEKAAEEIARKEHYDNSTEYAAYKTVIDQDQDHLFYEESIKFEGSDQLVALGFMQRGMWF
jgi:hypothetical protein